MESIRHSMSAGWPEDEWMSRRRYDAANEAENEREARTQQQRRKKKWKWRRARSAAPHDKYAGMHRKKSRFRESTVLRHPDRLQRGTEKLKEREKVMKPPDPL